MKYIFEIPYFILLFLNLFLFDNDVDLKITIICGVLILISIRLVDILNKITESKADYQKHQKCSSEESPHSE